MHLRIGSVTRKQNSLSAPPANSSLDLNLTGIRARDGISITAPVFILTEDVGDLSGYNYVYCITWGRYYFITDIRFDGHLQLVSCQEDCLASWNSVIRTQSFYCLRATVGYDDRIEDSQFPTLSGASNYDMDTENPWVSTLTSGFYVTGVISGNTKSYIGSTSYLVSRDLRDLVEGLLETTWEEVEGNLEAKAYADPMSNVVSCMYIPTNLDISVGAAPADLKIGMWDCPIPSGYYGILDSNSIIGGVVGTRIVELPAPTPPSGADRYYKHFPPYTTLTLYAPPFGDVELPEECYRWCLPSSYSGGYGGLRATIYIDVRTGYGMMAISPMGHTPQEYCAFVSGGQVGVDVSLSAITQSGMWKYSADRVISNRNIQNKSIGVLKNAVGKIASGIGNMLTGNIAGGIGNMADAGTGLVTGDNEIANMKTEADIQGLENTQPTTTSVGGIGDFGGLMIEQPWSIRLVFVNNKISNTNIGEPLMADTTPAGVSGGFAIFQNVSVSGEMLNSEKSIINQLLQSGVYIS